LFIVVVSRNVFISRPVNVLIAATIIQMGGYVKLRKWQQGTPNGRDFWRVVIHKHEAIVGVRRDDFLS